MENQEGYSARREFFLRPCSSKNEVVVISRRVRMTRRFLIKSSVNVRSIRELLDNWGYLVREDDGDVVLFAVVDRYGL